MRMLEALIKISTLALCGNFITCWLRYALYVKYADLQQSAPNGHERLRMFMRQKQLVKKFVAMQEIIVKSGTRPKRVSFRHFHLKVS